MTDTKSKRRVVGELRPSQLVYSFGVGRGCRSARTCRPWCSASMLGRTPTNGSARWRRRSRSSKSRVCWLRSGNDLALRFPNCAGHRSRRRSPRRRGEPFGQAEAGVGELVCRSGLFHSGWSVPTCRLLAPLALVCSSSAPISIRQDETRYVHENCKTPNRPVLPARFLVACEHGHIDDFPWKAFVHYGDNRLPARLRLVRVRFFRRCQTRSRCDATSAAPVGACPMRLVAEGRLAQCTGRHPHLAQREDKPCDKAPRTILLGASNAWFPITLSALSIPPLGDDLTKLVHERWSDIQDIEDVKEIARLRRRNAAERLCPLQRRGSPGRHRGEAIRRGRDRCEPARSEVTGMAGFHQSASGPKFRSVSAAVKSRRHRGSPTSSSESCWPRN